MKSAKRILAIVIAMLMVIGTCAVAVSAVEPPLQDRINAAAAGSTVKLTKQEVCSIVIENKNDLTLDLNGYELLGNPGEIALTIKNSNNITIKNGQVSSRFREFNIDTMTFDQIKAMASEIKHKGGPSAIAVFGGDNVTLAGLRVDAGRIKVPYMDGWEIPIGTAIQATNGADVLIQQVSTIGDYGVYNSNATVTVEDAILCGYMDAVKNFWQIQKAEGTEEMVNAADRISGALNAGVKWTDDEQAIADLILDDRIAIWTKSVEDEAPVIVKDGDQVYVEASVISHIWENGAGGKGTDCSYKYVPEYFVLENGTRYALTKDGDKYIANIDGEENVTEEAEIQYRLEFVLEQDIQDLIKEYDHWDEYWQQGKDMIASKYTSVNRTYNKYMDMIKGLFYGNDDFSGVVVLVDEVYDQIGYDLMENETYNNLIQALFALAGATIEVDESFSRTRNPDGTWNPGVNKPGAKLSDSAYGFYHNWNYDGNVANAFKDETTGKWYFDDNAADAPDGATAYYVYGTLDKIALLKQDLDNFMADFNNESTWPDFIYWMYMNYEAVIDMIPEVRAKLAALNATFDGLDLGAASDMADLSAITDVLALLDDADSALASAESAINQVLAMDAVQDKLADLETNTMAMNKRYIDDWIRIYHTRDQFVSKDNLILENGTVAKAYSVYGPIDLTIYNKVTLAIEGANDGDVVTYAADGEAAVAFADGESQYFAETITLAANAGANDDFLYWIDVDANEILSEEPTITFTEKKDYNVKAVFSPKGDIKVTLAVQGAYEDDYVTYAKDGNSPMNFAAGDTQLFAETITLTAYEVGNDEFQYWVNTNTNRIISTEKSITFNTKVDRKVTAVFATTLLELSDESFPMAYATFANNTGAIAGAFSFDIDDRYLDDQLWFNDQAINEPYLPGYNFDGWGYAVDDSYIDLDAASADSYVSGNSVFADTNANYSADGHALPVRDGSQSYIVLPKFSVNGDPIAVTFKDKAANKIYDAQMKYGYTTSVTAKGSNFSYWIDSDTGEIVSFSKTFKYQSIGNMTDQAISKNFEAVYGKSTSKPCASRIAFAAEGSNKYTLYMQRTMKSGNTLTSSGIVYKFGNGDNLKVNAPGTFTGISKSTAGDGTYLLGISKDDIDANGTLYAIPFMEVNGQIIYGTETPFTIA